ncbi:MAG: hypothetical protein V4503_10410 [Gemmatimonadota bacterium]
MAPKLTARQQAQLQWLENVPPRLEKATRIIEMMSTRHADDTQIRSLRRQLDEMKAQAAGLGLGAMADGFGYMGMLLRRTGGHEVKVRGLRELLAGVKVNFEGAFRAASTPEAGPEEDTPGEPVSP